jgi:prepilin-type N-terminal cleavage/methylation domain-containing protein
MVSGHLRRLNARGFTLAELLIVLAIIGILATLGYPYAARYLQAAKLRAAATELAVIINGARQLAITRNTQVCVMLSNNKALYKSGATTPCTTGTTFVGAGTASDGTIALQNDVQITASSANVTFTPLGAASPAGTYTVTNPTDGLTMAVVVSVAGRVSIQ